MKVKWLSSALIALNDEMEYLAKEDSELAIKLYELIMNKVKLLTNFPHIGRASQVPHVRELVITGFPFVIPYRVKSNEIHILSVFHTQRKPPELWQ